jgi:hypothetical protein
MIDKVTLNTMETMRFGYRMVWLLFHLKLIKNYKTYIPKNSPYCYDTRKEKNKYGIPMITHCAFHKNLFWDLCMYDNSDCCMDFCKTCGINGEEEEDGLV